MQSAEMSTNYLLFRALMIAAHFGDSAFLMPLSLALVVALIWQQHHAMALRFGLVVGAATLLTLVLKLGFYAVGGNNFLNIMSPSGHASFSATVYGCCAVALAKQRQLSERVVIFGLVALVVLTIAVSRIVTNDHTPQEVAIGTLIGMTAVATFSMGAIGLERLRLQMPLWLVILLVAGSVSVWAVGHRLNTEGRIEQWGIRLSAVWAAI